MKRKDFGFDLLDILLDKDNRDPIVMYDESGAKMKFEQVAVIPHQVGEERSLYCVLKPLSKIEGIADDEAIVFKVDMDDDGSSIIRVEEDEDTAREIFRKYELLLEEARANDNKGDED